MGVNEDADVAVDIDTPLPTAVSVSITAVFAAGGPLQRALPGYTPRNQQIELACQIGEAIADRGTLVAEAGTGTGKTFAYLVPALLHGGKVLISTGTKTLQDQLFSRDLPSLRAAMALPVTVALLKGRGNYVCHHHLEMTLHDSRLASRTEVAQLRKIEVFAKQTRRGDKAELADVPENAEIWNRVTSTRDNCLGSDCSFYRECFVTQARKEALEADVVVVNHALFLADLALRDEGISDLLPAADTVVFDEAHQLPAAATRFLGDSVSSHQLLDFARDATVAGLSHARESADWVALGQAVEQSARILRLACAAVEKMQGQRCAIDALPNRGEFGTAVQGVVDAIHKLGRIASAAGSRHPDLDAIGRRGPELIGRLARWLAGGVPTAMTAPSDPDLVSNDAEGGQSLAANVHAAAQSALLMDHPPVAPAAESAWPDTPAVSPTAPEEASEADPDDEWVRWVEVGANFMRLHAAPLSVAKLFSQHRRVGQAWIMTSATLSVHGDFTHFTRQLGLYDAQTGCWESPFDYANQSLLYVPHGVPEPQNPAFLDGFVDALLPLLEASQGSALILCTTLRAVDRIAARLQQEFEDRAWDWPLFRQGERSRRELLDRFRSSPHAVLVGSTSFWEGIDVPGDALTLVAIDKLPFAPPDDPVIDARIKASKSRGGNPFFEYQLPEAAIALKQGAGRLIRTERDWGVLMVGDRRLVEKPYGKRLWRGLPPFRRTRSLDDAVGFFAANRPIEGADDEA
jgi:ATP-dependent DNA helicase DinG